MCIEKLEIEFFLYIEKFEIDFFLYIEKFEIDFFFCILKNLKLNSTEYCRIPVLAGEKGWKTLSNGDKKLEIEMKKKKKLYIEKFEIDFFLVY